MLSSSTWKRKDSLISVCYLLSRYAMDGAPVNVIFLFAMDGAPVMTIHLGS